MNLNNVKIEGGKSNLNWYTLVLKKLKKDKKFFIGKYIFCMRDINKRGF